MGKRLPNIKPFFPMDMRSPYSFLHYACVLSFLSLAVVMLRISSTAFRLPPCSEQREIDGILHQDILRHHFMRGPLHELQQQSQLGEESGALPRTLQSVSAEPNAVPLPSTHNSVGEGQTFGRREIDDKVDTHDEVASELDDKVDTHDEVASELDDADSSCVLPTPIDRQRTVIRMPDLSSSPSCDGRRVYMYDLPPAFHKSILEQCDYKLADWLNFCPHLQHEGFGRPLSSNGNTDWFATDPYMLEVIFHARMPHYSCITSNSSIADAFFIPYYSGLDALRFLYGKNISDRAKQGVELVSWLEENAAATWKRHGGDDHFIVMGRTAWDFTRPLNVTDSWGTSLYSLPEMENVTALFLERRPWRRNDQAIPYPTAFHPRSLNTMREWQNKVRSAQRSYLFAFVGAPRSGIQGSIRQSVLEQCLNASSSACAFLNCREIRCAHDPGPIAEKLLQSEFCLQPPGDTSTRRSTFDGMLSGCIPVFFHQDSAYNQYTWHLPKDPQQYSVLIPDKDLNNVQQILSSYSREQILSMREAVIDLIPKIIYASSAAVPEFTDHSLKDAFDLSVEGMLERVAERRRLDHGSQ